MANKQNEEKMKLKIIKIILQIIILLIIVILIIIYYFIIMDRKSKPIEKENMNYEIKTEEFFNRNVFVVSPKNDKNTTVILYLHGGAYVEGIAPEYWTFIEKIINDTNATIIIPDYPLAPKYSYVDVFNMIEPLYKKIINKINPENLILMGDSAGGGMALSLLEKLDEEEIAFPSQTILVSPWLDVTMENSKIKEIQELDTLLNKDVLKLAGIAYAKNEENTKNWLVSPIYGDLSIINNLTIFIGTHDILNPDVHILIEKAKEQGGIVELKEYEQAKHIWIIENNSNEAIVQKAYKDLIEKIKKTKK